jgi:dTMP kinase
MIVCDGGNGAGKSSVLKEIENHLKRKQIDFVMTREPGGTVIGEKIRDILLDKDTTEMFDITELMLFAAARAQHVREKIIPAIKAGRVVVSDRFDSATFSFQHYGRGLPLELIKNLNNIALAGFKPDMTIILDIEPQMGLERVISRGSNLDRMEIADLEFLTRARNGYLEQAKVEPHLFRVIDASKPLNEVIEDSLKIVDYVIHNSSARVQ